MCFQGMPMKKSNMYRVFIDYGGRGEEAEKFAELLYKGNSKTIQVYISGVVKDFQPVSEG